MKFHAYETLFDRAKRDPRVEVDRRDFGKFYGNLNWRLHLIHNHDEILALSFEKSIVEYLWHRDGRPYYKMWPSIVEPFVKLNLDIPGTVIKQQTKAMLVRFAENHELVMPCGDKGKLHAILTAVVQDADRRMLRVVYRFDDGSGPNDTSDGSFCISLTDNKLESLIENEYARFSDVENGKLVARIACTVLLLENDPSIIQPDVLAADRERFDVSTDPAFRQRLIDKAKRRGIVGWRIGEQYEVCPHYRRPHFALRHTGKGRTVPRIVPIHGCIVHRQKVTEVPTGYLTPEGEEIES